MVQTAVARPLLWGFLILWIAAFCRASNDDDGGGYFILDDGFPVSHLQQHLPATGVDATTATAEEYLCFKLSAALYSMVEEGLTLSWNPTHVSAGSRLRMPTTLRGEGLWGERLVQVPDSRMVLVLETDFGLCNMKPVMIMRVQAFK